jgi:hypothetical protein
MRWDELLMEEKQLALIYEYFLHFTLKPLDSLSLTDALGGVVHVIPSNSLMPPKAVNQTQKHSLLPPHSPPLPPHHHHREPHRRVSIVTTMKRERERERGERAVLN